jgi:hypothetical protein
VTAAIPIVFALDADLCRRRLCHQPGAGKTLGPTLPIVLLRRADEVIEQACKFIALHMSAHGTKRTQVGHLPRSAFDRCGRSRSSLSSRTSASSRVHAESLSLRHGARKGRLQAENFRTGCRRLVGFDPAAFYFIRRRYSDCSVDRCRSRLFCWSANDKAHGQQQDAAHGASGAENEPIRASVSHLIAPPSKWSIKLLYNGKCELVHTAVANC